LHRGTVLWRRHRASRVRAMRPGDQRRTLRRAATPIAPWDRTVATASRKPSTSNATTATPEAETAVQAPVRSSAATSLALLIQILPSPSLLRHLQLGHRERQIHRDRVHRLVGQDLLAPSGDGRGQEGVRRGGHHAHRALSHGLGHRRRERWQLTIEAGPSSSTPCSTG